MNRLEWQRAKRWGTWSVLALQVVQGISGSFIVSSQRAFAEEPSRSRPERPDRPGRPDRPDRPGVPTPPPVPPPSPSPVTPPSSQPSTPPAGPSASEIEQARRDGQYDGEPDGQREGRERGWENGLQEGRRDGRRAGYDRCLAERRQAIYDQGYAEGWRVGQSEGRADGDRRGALDGQEQGRSAGSNDGDRRASADATQASEAPAREQGRREADATDAIARGTLAGTQAGEARARKTAVDSDYPKGRESYRAERFAEPIQQEVEERMSEGSSVTISRTLVRSDSAAMPTLLDHRVQGGYASPDYRYARERRRYADSSLQNAYSDGYRSGYRSGFDSAFSFEYRRGEQVGRQQGRDEGCREAQWVDIRGDFLRGRQEGQRRAYQESYDEAYRLAYRLAYQPAFEHASDSTYRDRYSGYYQAAFERFRVEAYSSRVEELYQAGFSQAEKARFSEVYPGFAAQEYQRGVSDERQEFAQRPIRFIDSGSREQFQDGVIEPGESVAFWFVMRNFSDQSVSASDLRFEVETSGKGIVALRGVDIPKKAIPSRGAIRVTSAVPILVSEAALNQKVGATLRVYWRGTLVATRAYSFTVQNRATLEFVEKPILREGLETQIRVRIRNQSSQPIQGPVRVELRSNSRLVELTDVSVDLEGLAPGESREVAFRAIGRSDQDQPEIPLAAMASDGARRRVAIRDFSGAVPILNDYRIHALGDLSAVKSGGLVRFQYRLRNVSSRLLFGSLEVHARLLDDSGQLLSGVRWIGFNPQFLLPLEQGEEVAFVIPAFLTTPASSGKLELEVRESGVPVVIHQVQF